MRKSFNYMKAHVCVEISKRYENMLYPVDNHAFSRLIHQNSLRLSGQYY